MGNRLIRRCALVARRRGDVDARAGRAGGGGVGMQTGQTGLPYRFTSGKRISYAKLLCVVVVDILLRRSGPTTTTPSRQHSFLSAPLRRRSVLSKQNKSIWDWAKATISLEPVDQSHLKVPAAWGVSRGGSPRSALQVPPSGATPPSCRASRRRTARSSGWRRRC